MPDSSNLIPDPDSPAAAYYSLERYFRCRQSNARYWLFEASIVVWPEPHEPKSEWRVFRRWCLRPSESELQQARRDALQDLRFYRVCSHCHEINNLGHMWRTVEHAVEGEEVPRANVCQGCAERHFGVQF